MCVCVCVCVFHIHAVLVSVVDHPLKITQLGHDTIFSLLLFFSFSFFLFFFSPLENKGCHAPHLLRGKKLANVFSGEITKSLKVFHKQFT